MVGSFSDHIRTVPACNRRYDNRHIVLSYWNITLQAQSYDILTGHIILATDRVNQFLCRVFGKGASFTNLSATYIPMYKYCDKIINVINYFKMFFFLY